MTTDKTPKSIAAILARAEMVLASSREDAEEDRVLLADARALSAEFDVLLHEQAKLKARLLEGAPIASASPVELDQIAATLDAIRKARA